MCHVPTHSSLQLRSFVIGLTLPRHPSNILQQGYILQTSYTMNIEQFQLPQCRYNMIRAILTIKKKYFNISFYPHYFKSMLNRKVGVEKFFIFYVAILLSTNIRTSFFQHKLLVNLFVSNWSNVSLILLRGPLIQRELIARTLLFGWVEGFDPPLRVMQGSVNFF